MKILFYQWRGVDTEVDAIEILRKIGMEVILFEYPLKNYNEDEGIEDHIKKICMESAFDCIFSFNYFPVLSSVSNRIGVKYISWVFDSPHLTLYSKTVLNDCNEIYLFDYCVYHEMSEKNRGNVHYLPLAVNAGRLSEQEKFYEPGYLYEVSFVGNMYNNEYNFYDQIKYLPEYIKGYLEGSMQAQLKIYGYDFLNEQLNQEIMNQILRYVKLGMSDQYFPAEKEIFLNMLRRKMTVMERMEFMKAISEHFPTALYTHSATPELPKVKNMGYAEYLKQMPEVFKRSKINLNITLRSILSGIPLRVLDIMGAGGFVLSNYQAEIEEHFKMEEEIVVYGSLEECIEKIAYYLAQDDKRERIAENGCRRVRQEFSYENQLQKIFG